MPLLIAVAVRAYPVNKLISPKDFPLSFKIAREFLFNISP